MGDHESLAALQRQCTHHETAHKRALAEYDAAHDLLTDFNKRALLWVEYSNKRQLSEEERELVNQVYFVS